MTEHNAQKLLVAWFRTKYERLAKLLFAIPNGGLRNKITGKRLKDEGLLAGVPDLMLAMPSGGYHGLFIEMKRAHGGILAKTQIEMHRELFDAGYAVRIPRGYEEAKRVIEEYLECK